MSEYYVFYYDKVAWQQSDTIWQSFDDAMLAARHILDSNPTYSVTVAISTLGSFPVCTGSILSRLELDKRSNL